MANIISSMHAYLIYSFLRSSSLSINAGNEFAFIIGENGVGFCPSLFPSLVVIRWEPIIEILTGVATDKDTFVATWEIIVNLVKDDVLIGDKIFRLEFIIILKDLPFYFKVE